MSINRCVELIKKIHIHTHTNTHTHTHTHTHNLEYYSTIKKNEIVPLDLEGIMLSEIHQRKTNTIYSHLYMEYKNQNKLTNKTKEKQTYRYREQIGSCQRGGG